MLALFWQSLISFTTTSMGENYFSSVTIAVYAIVLGIVSYILLVNQLCRLHGAGSDFSKALKGHTKSYVTIPINSVAAIVSILGLLH